MSLWNYPAKMGTKIAFSSVGGSTASSRMIECNITLEDEVALVTPTLKNWRPPIDDTAINDMIVREVRMVITTTYHLSQLMRAVYPFDRPLTSLILNQMPCWTVGSSGYELILFFNSIENVQDAIHDLHRVKSIRLSWDLDDG
jgi:hypothetical protein